MAAFQFDNNTWYTIQNAKVSGLYASASAAGIIAMKPQNESDPSQYFQFVQTDLNSYTYVVRSKGPGPIYYLTEMYSPQVGYWAATMLSQQYDSHDATLLWNVTSTGDGYYFLTTYSRDVDQLNIDRAVSNSSSGNITYVSALENQPGWLDRDPDFELGFRFNFNASTKIDDPAYSEVQSPTAAIESLLEASKHKIQLSGGAIAGIVIGSVAGTVIVLALGFFLLRRRGKTKANKKSQLEHMEREAEAQRDSDQATLSERKTGSSPP